jgi:hypothetical protein
MNYLEKMKRFKEIFGFSAPLNGDLIMLGSRLSVNLDVTIDILKLDVMLAAKHPNYNADNCLLDGKSASVADAIRRLYGEEALELVNSML